MFDMTWIPYIVSIAFLILGIRMFVYGLNAIRNKDSGDGPLDVRLIILPASVLIYFAIHVFTTAVWPHWLE